MRLSILIPSLNRRALLARALDSARRQTRSAHEILVSDDGSTDGTPEFVNQLSAVDPRVRLLPRNPVPGIFTNFNYLVSQSTGDAHCLLGDDDRLEPTYLERLAAPLEANPRVVAVFCDHGIIDIEGRRLVEAGRANSENWGRTSLPQGVVREPIRVALRQALCIGFALFRSSVFKGEPFDVACGGAADVDYVLRAAGAGDLYFLPELLGDYGMHAGTATRTKALYMVEGMVHALRKHAFIGEAELERVQAMRKALLSRAVLTASSNRRASLGALGEYLRLGGSPASARAVSAALVAISPRLVARRVDATLRAFGQVLADRVPGAARSSPV